jgi:transcriptional regulator with GAF, ATPase, and Fis domain
MTTAPRDRDQAFAEAVVVLADTMVADYDVVDLMDRLCGFCVELLPVAAAGLLLTDQHGDLRLLASSNERARLVELFQLENDHQGPILEAYRTGQPIVIADLGQYRDRWPGFIAEVRRQGFHAVHALPMRLRENVIGALSLFDTTATSLSVQDRRLAQAVADVATIGILQQRALTRGETLIEQLQGALNSRLIIEQAKGVLSERGDLDIDEAFTLLRDYARAHQQRLSALARAVVHDRSQATRVLRNARRGTGNDVAR